MSRVAGLPRRRSLARLGAALGAGMLLAVGSLGLAPAAVCAAPGATLTSPTDGATLVDPNRPFTWDAVSGADGYWLWVGTSPGTNDVVNTGQLSRTSYTARTLPPGRTLYARLWTVSAGVWSSAPDVAFTAAPALTTPANGARDIDTSRDFAWTSDFQATGYELTIGTSQGASDVLDTGPLSSTSASIPGLPAGRALWARLTTSYASGAIAVSDTSFTARVRPALVSAPQDGAIGVAAGRPVAWSAPGGADSYWLWVGTSPGAKDVVNSGPLTTTSYTPKSLPPGKKLYARLWTTSGAISASAPDVSFSVAPYLTYPTDGARDVDTTRSFTWGSDAQATSYRLRIGTTSGGSDLVDSGPLTTTSYAVPGLPAGRTLYARLTTQYAGSSTDNDVSFTARVRTTQLTRPVNGAQNADLSKGFAWNPVSGADAYWLWVGTSPGASDVINTGKLTRTTYVPTKPLPPGKTFYARLWTMSGGISAHAPDVAFTALVTPAAISSPKDGASGVDTLQPIQWNTVEGADGYWLWIGTTPGSSDLVSTGKITRTSYVAQGLPPGRTLYARLWTMAAGKSVAGPDVAFTAAPSFSFPLNGAQNVDANRALAWTADSKALAYRVTIGRTQGASDVLDSGSITSTSVAAPGLPTGTKLWARLTTDYGDTSSTSDVSFTASPSFAYPASRSTGIDPSRAFRWSPATPASGKTTSYRLTIGSTPAGADLYDSGSLAGTTATVPASALPADRTLYARVAIAVGDGSTTYADSVFTVAGSPDPTTAMSHPTDGMSSVDVRRPFRWTPTPFARAYRLKLSSGGSVVRDTGDIHVPMYFAEDLPAGSYTGELSLQLADGWHSASTFSFTVDQTGSSMDEEIAAAQQATDIVRQMADIGTYPFPWTPLYAQVHGRGATKSLCSDFAPTLVTLLKEMAVTRRLPAAQQSFDLDIGFMHNTTDVHTLVKMYDTDTSSWIMLDPTFDLTMKRSSDGAWASPDDVHAATLSRSWADIQYVFLGDAGDAYARRYHIDYPLLYLHLPGGTWPDARPYMTAVDPPSSGYTDYAISSAQSQVTATIDGQSQTLDVFDGLTRLFYAHSIALPSGSTAQVYRANRYVF